MACKDCRLVSTPMQMESMFKIEVIMDTYKKKYKEALETARKINSGEGVAAPPDWTICEVIFPELKESGDEKVRKALINLFKIENFNGYTTLNGIDVDDVITWLEKQKTSEEAIKYLEENHSPSEISDFQAAMNIAVAKAYDRGRKDAERQGEKPKWGDDDEQYLLVCKNALHKYQVSDKWDADIISKWLEDKLKQEEERNPKWTDEDEKKENVL